MGDPRPEGPIRIVYFGTPEFAVPALRALHADPRFEVVLVVTQPDRPAGRGRKLFGSSVKQSAVLLGLDVYQPERLRTEEQRQPLVECGADVFVVAAYGVIFGPRTLAIPPHGCLNLHASILPAHRGASPISASIAAGETVTGVTLMKMEAGLDTGPMLGVGRLSIEPRDTTASLTQRLAVVAADLATDLIPGWVGGSVPATPQPAGATLTRPLTKADGWLDWRRPAEDLEAHVRAMWPWPRAWTTVDGPDGSVRTIQVHAASVIDEPIGANSTPGRVAGLPGSLVVATGAGQLRLETVQEPGGRPVNGAMIRSTGRLSTGTALGQRGAPEAQRPMVTPVDGDIRVD